MANQPVYPHPASQFFVFSDTATPQISTLSLHDALPISATAKKRPEGLAPRERRGANPVHRGRDEPRPHGPSPVSVGIGDRKSTRLNSSHSQISYAVFCLKKKNQNRRAGPDQDQEFLTTP